MWSLFSPCPGFTILSLHFYRNQNGNAGDRRPLFEVTSKRRKWWNVWAEKPSSDPPFILKKNPADNTAGIIKNAFQTYSARNWGVGFLEKVTWRRRKAGKVWHQTLVVICSSHFFFCRRVSWGFLPTLTEATATASRPRAASNIEDDKFLPTLCSATTTTTFLHWTCPFFSRAKWVKRGRIFWWWLFEPRMASDLLATSQKLLPAAMNFPKAAKQLATRRLPKYLLRLDRLCDIFETCLVY